MMSSDLKVLGGGSEHTLVLMDGDKRYLLRELPTINVTNTYEVEGYYQNIKFINSPLDMTFEMTKRTTEMMYAAMKRNFYSNNYWRRQGHPYTRTKVLARIKRNEKRKK